MRISLLLMEAREARNMDGAPFHIISLFNHFSHYFSIKRILTSLPDKSGTAHSPLIRVPDLLVPFKYHITKIDILKHALTTISWEICLEFKLRLCSFFPNLFFCSFLKKLVSFIYKEKCTKR